MTTLILPPRYTEDSIALGQAAGRAGWDVERLAGWRVPEWLAGVDAVLYGEPLFAAVVAQSLNVALLEPTFRWLAELPERWRRRQVECSRLGHARELTAPTFVKPADDKCFQAGVYDSGAALPVPGILPDDVPVLLSEVVTWGVEFRFFVLEGRVTTFSPYLREGRLAREPDGSWSASEAERRDALAFAESVLGDPEVVLPPGVVLDVGIIADRGWALVEANAAWGSGIYACDPDAVLRVVRRSCVRADAISPSDRPWVVERA